MHRDDDFDRDEWDRRHRGAGSLVAFGDSQRREPEAYADTLASFGISKDKPKPKESYEK